MDGLFSGVMNSKTHIDTHKNIWKILYTCIHKYMYTHILSKFISWFYHYLICGPKEIIPFFCSYYHIHKMAWK